MQRSSNIQDKGFCACLLLAGHGRQDRCILMGSLLLVSISISVKDSIDAKMSERACSPILRAFNYNIGHKLMDPPSMVLLGLLLVYGLAYGVQQTQGSQSDSSHGRGRTQEFESSEDGLEREFLYAGRSKRAPADQQQDKCSYTFIVPQQKVTGAICVNSKEPEALLENRVNKQELELLNVELQKQKRQNRDPAATGGGGWRHCQ
ncbi:hypothetical protein L3Q82_022855 [Scortum barcoo]|uniref:Uncharacterized protein n=1 Tax=Scortum barcoo TaxID=214431 RepID=A0ACB8WWC9_9TELE|nr:hypothetical protein L3Q82_022855 [Scortum barcoo]